MRTVVLVALVLLAGFAAAAPTASASTTCDGLGFEPGPALDETYYFACGRIDCVLAGLPNIMVTCL